MTNRTGSRAELRSATPQDDRMEKITLWSETGRPACEIEMPFARPRVKVLLWSQRVFVWSDVKKRYAEGECYLVESTYAKSA